MGEYSTAHLVYGWKVPSDTWMVDNLFEHLGERLTGSGIGFYLDGHREWSDFERDLILTVGEMPSFSAREGVTRIPHTAVNRPNLKVTIAGAKAIENRLGITLTEAPGWWLGCSIG